MIRWGWVCFEEVRRSRKVLLIGVAETPRHANEQLIQITGY